MTGTVKFEPPYLRYSDPVDNKKIKSIIKNFRLRWFASGVKTEATAVVDAAIGSWTEGGGTSSSGVSSGTIGEKGQAAARRVRGVQPVGRKAGMAAEVTASQPVPLKTTADITVTPSGNVSLGFNCRKTFTATAPVGSAYWEIHTYSPQTGVVPHQLIGETNSTSSSTSIEFILDYSVYGLTPGGGFLVVVTAPTGIPLQSDMISLNFNSEPPCSIIHHVRFHDSVTGQELGAECSLKGGDHGTEPLFRVWLDVNAKPGGQPIRIRSKNKNKVWLWGPGASKKEFADFVVPGGQQSFADSGIFGTANVSVTGWNIQVLTCILYPDGTEGPPSYAEISLLK